MVFATGRKPGCGLALLGAFLCLAPPLRAQAPDPSGKAGIIQQLGSSVTMDLEFRDERGAPITLREASGGKPFVLALVYYRCPMLCNLILGGLLETLIALDPSAGEAFTVVTASFDPSEGPDLASAKKTHYLRAYGRPSGDSGWRFLSDKSGAAERLCRESGYRISYDAATRQYAHASAILVLTPEGKISRYFMGVTYPARDVRLALVEASRGKIGSVSDQLLLLCYSYDPAAGRYTLAVWRVLRIAGAVTALGIVLLIVRLSRRPSAAPTPAASAPGAGSATGGG
jgi:protein SCO1/2